MSTRIGASIGTSGLQISVSSRSTCTTVHLDGEVDLATVTQLRAALADVDGPIVVDCSQLAFIDAVGLGVIAGAARREGGVQLTGPSPLLVRMLDAVDLHHLLVAETSSCGAELVHAVASPAPASSSATSHSAMLRT
jgi:anti-anti-sigma factor